MGKKEVFKECSIEISQNLLLYRKKKVFQFFWIHANRFWFINFQIHVCFIFHFENISSNRCYLIMIVTFTFLWLMMLLLFHMSLVFLSWIMYLTTLSLFLSYTSLSLCVFFIILFAQLLKIWILWDLQANGWKE